MVVQGGDAMAWSRELHVGADGRKRGDWRKELSVACGEAVSQKGSKRVGQGVYVQLVPVNKKDLGSVQVLSMLPNKPARCIIRCSREALRAGLLGCTRFKTGCEIMT